MLLNSCIAAHEPLAERQKVRRTREVKSRAPSAIFRGPCGRHGTGVADASGILVVGSSRPVPPSCFDGGGVIAACAVRMMLRRGPYSGASDGSAPPEHARQARRAARHGRVRTLPAACGAKACPSPPLSAPSSTPAPLPAPFQMFGLLSKRPRRLEGGTSACALTIDRHREVTSGMRTPAAWLGPFAEAVIFRGSL